MIPIAQLHPIIVHFPIVFFITLAVFDTVAVARGYEIFGQTVTGNISTALAVLSGLAAIIAYMFGDLAFDAAISSGVADVTLETHEAFGTTTAILFAVWAIVRGYVWWRGTRIEGNRKSAAIAIEIAGVLLIVTTAYFGGQLVYDLGVNVSRMTG